MSVAAMNEQPRSQPASDPDAPQWERGFSIGMHLTTLTMTFIPVVPALVMWQIKRQESPFVDDHGREVVNFQISLVLYAIAAGILTVVTVGLAAIVLWPALVIFTLITLVMGAVAAGNGRYFRYPACIRLIK